MKQKDNGDGNGDSNGEGNQDVQEEAAVNILGNVINEMGDGLEVTIEVEIETTGANAENRIQEDEIQNITQSEGTQQEIIEAQQNMKYNVQNESKLKSCMSQKQKMHSDNQVK